MQYNLDTNIIIDLLKEEKITLLKIKNLAKEGAVFAINPIVLSELYKGAYLSQKQEENVTSINEIAENIDFLEFTKETSKIFGEKYAILKRKGKVTSEADLMIASITIAHERTLLTKNGKDFKNIEGLKLLEI